MNQAIDKQRGIIETTPEKKFSPTKGEGEGGEGGPALKKEEYTKVLHEEHAKMRKIFSILKGGKKRRQSLFQPRKRVGEENIDREKDIGFSMGGGGGRVALPR